MATLSPVYAQDGNRAVRRRTGETIMANEKGPNVKKKQKCNNFEGKGLVTETRDR
jgi:hypothetical protein